MNADLDNKANVPSYVTILSSIASFIAATIAVLVAMLWLAPYGALAIPPYTFYVSWWQRQWYKR